MMKSKFTKKQRYKIYHEAMLKLNGTGCHLCNILSGLAKYKTEYYMTDAAEIIRQFPEFGLFRPKGKPYVWFYNDAERFLCMNFCKQMAKE